MSPEQRQQLAKYAHRRAVDCAFGVQETTDQQPNRQNQLRQLSFNWDKVSHGKGVPPQKQPAQ